MMQVRSQLVVRVTPNARHSEILGWGMDEKGRSVLMVKLAAQVCATLKGENWNWELE